MLDSSLFKSKSKMKVKTGTLNNTYELLCIREVKPEKYRI